MDTSTINANMSYASSLEVEADGAASSNSYGVFGLSGTMLLSTVNKKLENSSIDAWSDHMYVVMTDSLKKIDKQIEELKTGARNKSIKGGIGMASAGVGVAKSAGSLAG